MDFSYIEARGESMSVEYLVDAKGKRKVVMDLEDYEELLERIEDVEALAMLREMRKRPLEFRWFEDVISELS